MSGIVRVTLVLAGALRGHTGVLNGYRFDDGTLTIEGAEDQVASIATYFERSYQAFPEGDPRIEAINEACAEADREAAKEAAADEAALKSQQEGAGDGQREPSATPESGDSNPVHGDARPDGDQTPAETADAGTGAAPDATGAEGSVAGGDGYTDPRIPDPESEQESGRTRHAVASLDPEIDDHWTPDGFPAISAVESLTGEGGVTRDAIDAVAMGYTREHARKPVEEIDAPAGEGGAQQT